MNLVFNCGDFFRTFVLIRRKSKFCVFAFFISYLCPLSYQMLHYTLGPGERRLLGPRLDFLFFLLHFGFENDILHSNFKLYVYPNVYANYTLLISH